MRAQGSDTGPDPACPFGTVAHSTRCACSSSTTTTRSPTTSSTSSRSWAPRSWCGRATQSRSPRRARFVPDGLVVSPGPGRPSDAGNSIELVRELGGDDADARCLPRAPGDRRGVRRRDRAGPHRSSTGRRARSATTDAGSSPAFPRRSTSGATTRSPQRRSLTTLEVTARTDDGEVMGVRHRDLPDRRRPVPPRERPDADRPRDAAHVPRLPSPGLVSPQELTSGQRSRSRTRLPHRSQR